MTIEAVIFDFTLKGSWDEHSVGLTVVTMMILYLVWLFFFCFKWLRIELLALRIRLNGVLLSLLVYQPELKSLENVQHS